MLKLKAMVRGNQPRVSDWFYVMHGGERMGIKVARSADNALHMIFDVPPSFQVRREKVERIDSART